VTAEGFELIEVTADEGIHAWAPDLPGLFRAAAMGLWSLMVEPEAVRPVETVPVEVEASDRETLLVAWLNELLYLHEVKTFAAAGVHVREVTENRLRAEVRGERLDPARHRLVGHVKAVTYHGLRVEGGPGGWEARVIVDV
jgi:SHS2 domain-containing protein